MGYLNNNIRNFIKYRNGLLFSLLLFISLVNSVFITPTTSDLKIRIGLFVMFFFVNSIISYFLTTSRVENIIKMQFDRLLSSCSWGFKKVISFYYLFDLLQLLLINFTACTAYVIYDVLINNSRAVTAVTNFIPSYCVATTIVSGLIIILLIHYSLTLLTRNFIGNISAVIVVLFCILNLGVVGCSPCVSVFVDILGIRYYHSEHLQFQSNIFFLNRLFSVVVIIAFFFFSIYCYSRGFFENLFGRINIKTKRSNLINFKGTLLSLIKYHWSFVWNNKLFIVLLLLFSFAAFIEAIRPLIDEFGNLRQYTPMTLQDRFGDELTPLFMTIIAIFIPINLFDALRSNKFYRLTHSLPLNNISIVISIFIATILLFAACLSLRVVINVTAMYINTGIINLSLIWWVMGSLISSSWSYLFLMAGIIGLFLASGKKSLTIIFMFCIYVFNSWLLNWIKYEDLNPDWLLISWGNLPKTRISDVNPDLSRWEFLIFYHYLIYWISISILLITFFSSFYPRGEKKSIIARIRDGRFERRGIVYTTIVIFTLTISILSGYRIHILQKESSDQYNRNSEAIKQYSILYRNYFFSPHPEVISALFEVDLYPNEERLRVSGSYWLKNTAHIRIDSLMFTIPLREDASIRLESLTIHTPSEEIIRDSIRHFYLFKLAQPLLLNDSVKVSYVLNIRDLGKKTTRGVYISPKWTLIRSNSFAIYPGFWIEREDVSDQIKLYDQLSESGDYARKRLIEREFSDYPIISLIVSAPKGQIIVCDGILEGKTKKADREFYHYNSLHRTRLYNFPVIASSEYEKIDTCINNTLINLYYIPLHRPSSKYILQNATSILSSYSLMYGGLDLPGINIVEAAGYRGRGGSCFTNTLFFSEDQFTADFTDTTHLIRANLVLAHELAHLWWSGMQPFAFMAKSSIAYEGLAEYSSIQQIPSIHKNDLSRYYLKYLMRNINLSDKLPLYETVDRDAIYSKAPLIFRRISMSIGKEMFENILKAFIINNKGEPTTLPELVNYIKYQSTRDTALIEELFSHNIVYDNSLQIAEILSLGNNNYMIDIEYCLNKQKSLMEKKINVPFSTSETIDITFLKNDEIIYSEKVKMTNGSSKFSKILKIIPDKVVLDYNMLYIDNPKDNELNVKQIIPINKL